MSIIFLDLETTGLINEHSDILAVQPQIIEIGLIHQWSEENEPRSISSLINPKVPLSEKITEITGITDEDLKDQPPFSLYYSRLCQIFMGCEVIVTFNGNAFDLKVLEFELKRINREFQFPWPPVRTDIMLQSTDYVNMKGRDGIKPPKLMELYKFLFDEEFTGHHRALDDAKATKRCYDELCKRGVL
jgi:DNA polymerase III epsilon subunit-like protein